MADGHVKIRVSTDTKQIKDLQKQLTEAQKEIERLTAAAEKEGEAAKQAGEKGVQAAQQQAKVLSRNQSQYDNLTRKAAQLREEMSKIGTVKAPTEEYSALKEELEKTQKEMTDLTASKHGVEIGAYAKQVNAQLAEMQTRCEEITAQMQAMEEAGTDSKEGLADPEKYDKLNAQLTETESKMRALEQAAESAGEAAASKEQGDALNFLQSFTRMTGSTQRAILSLRSSTSTTMGKIGAAMGIAVKAASSLASAVASVSKRFLALGKNVVTAGAKIVSSGIKAALSGIASMATAAGKAFVSFGKLAGSAIKSIASTALNKITEAFTDQLEAAQEAGILAGDSLNELEDALTDVGNALVSAFTPIIEFVIPYLTALSEVLTSVINKFGEFFASLTGQTSYTKLTKLEETTDDVSDSAEDASNNLASFDEINVLSQDEDETAADDEYDYETEEVAIESWTDALEEALAALEAFDAFQFGSDLADKVAGWLESIDWDYLQEWAAAIGTKAAELLNGIFDDLDLAWDVGDAIAEGLNTINTLFNNFLRTFDFDGLGEWLGTVLNAFTEGLDWELIGENFSLGLNGITSTVKSFFETTDFYSLFAGIGTAIQTALTGIDWVNMAETVLAGVSAITDAINGFVDNIDFVEIADQMIEGIKTLVSGMVIDENGEAASVWTENGEAVARLINSFFEGLLEFVTEFPWVDMANSIADWFVAALDGVNWENIGETIHNFITGLIDAICTFLQRDDLAETLATAISDFFAGLDILDIAVGIMQLALSIVTFLINFISSLFSEQLDALSTAWESFWTAFADVVKQPINAVIGFLNTVIGGFETMINAVIDALNMISIDLPDLLGGGHIGFDLDSVSLGRIPELANGAVIAGGNPFAAILGDQAAGQTNIETPLETMVEAFETALDSRGYNSGVNSVTLELDGKQLAAASLDYYTSELNRRGSSVSTALGVS